MALLCWGLQGASPGAAGEPAALGHAGVAQPSACSVSICFWPGGCVSAVSQGWEAGREQGHVAGVSPCVLCH